MAEQYVGLTGEFTNLSVGRVEEKGDDVARFAATTIRSVSCQEISMWRRAASHITRLRLTDYRTCTLITPALTGG